MAKKGKPGKKAKPRKGANGASLLTRLFRKDDKGKAADGSNGKGARPKARAKPLTPLDRSIQEIKHMAKVGESDPERLAMMLSKLISQQVEKERQAKEEFDRMVWDIVHKSESSEDDESADDRPGDGQSTS